MTGRTRRDGDAGDAPPLGDAAMQTHSLEPTHAQAARWLRVVAPLGLTLLTSTVAYAQAVSPWERAATNLEVSFTGPLARSMALVAIVLGGLMFMYGEGGAKRQISGIVFGGGLALFAAQFLAWLF
jgi:type IV secretory pathway VirB2 component (pilin)